MVGHPFIVYGNVGTLGYLKSLGYKTFDKWIDESYDEIIDESERCYKIVSEVSKFSKMSVDELKKIRQEMNEVCLHNQENYKKVYKERYDEHGNSYKVEEVLSNIWDKIK